MGKGKLYDCESVGIAAFLGSPFAGAALMAVNEHRLGRTARVPMALFGGMAATGGLIALGVLTQGALKSLGFAIPFLVRQAAKEIQGADVERHVAEGGALGSRWFALLVGCMGMAVIVAASVGLVVAAGVMQGVARDAGGPGTPFKASETEIVFHKPDATEGDARRLATALRELKYFNGSRRSNVLLRKDGDLWVVSFCVKPGAWEKQDMVAAFTVIGGVLRKGAFHDEPLEVHLCDANVTVHRRIVVPASDSTRASPEIAASKTVSFDLLVQAVSKDEADEVRRLLKAGVDPNGKDEKGRSALALAVLAGKGDCVDALVQGGARVDDPMEKGFTLLQLVVIKKDAPMAERLLRLGAEASLPVGKDRYTALHFAANNKDLAMARVLLKAKADANARDAAGCGPLVIAGLQEARDVVDLLLEHGADPNLKNTNGDTLLHTLVAMGKTDMALFLLEHGADPKALNQTGANALHLAAATGRSSLLAPMLKKGVPVDVTTKGGDTALYAAVSTGRSDCLVALLKAGADPNLTPRRTGALSPLDLALSRSKADMVDALLASPKIRIAAKTRDRARTLEDDALVARIEARARALGGPSHAWASATGPRPPNPTAAPPRPPVRVRPTKPRRRATKDERRALAKAAMEGDLSALRRLVDDGVSPDQTVSKGRTALHYAAVKGKTEVAGFLLERGARPGLAARDGRDALFLAARGGHEELVKLLLAKGAPVAQTDEKGYTPLHAAVSKGRHAIARRLVAAGADPEGGKASRTPLDMARAKGDAEMLRILRR